MKSYSFVRVTSVQTVSFSSSAKGDIDKGLAGLATALSSIGATLEDHSKEIPTVVVDTEET